MKKYLNRLIETTIKRELEALGCVVIEGPKWCGKSTTGERFAKSVVKLQNPIKVGGNLIDEAAKNLLKLKNKVDSFRIKEPSFLMVLSGVPTAYKRPDGVLVVPIGCLKD